MADDDLLGGEPNEEWTDIKTDDKANLSLVLTRQLDRISQNGTNLNIYEAPAVKIWQFFFSICVFESMVIGDLRTDFQKTRQEIDNLLVRPSVNNNREAVVKCNEYLQHVIREIPQLLKKRSMDVDA